LINKKELEEKTFEQKWKKEAWHSRFNFGCISYFLYRWSMAYLDTDKVSEKQQLKNGKN